jgi:hypothetical protein
MFLANLGMDRSTGNLHLNQTEAAKIAGLVPRQILIKQPGLSKVNLTVDRKGYWLYTNDPRDSQKNEALNVTLQEGLKPCKEQSMMPLKNCRLPSILCASSRRRGAKSSYKRVPSAETVKTAEVAAPARRPNPNPAPIQY